MSIAFNNKIEISKILTGLLMTGVGARADIPVAKKLKEVVGGDA